METIIQLSSLVVALISAIIALVTTLQAKKAAKFSANSSLGTFVLNQRKEYKSKEMKIALQKLKYFYNSNKESFIDKFLSERLRNEDLDNYRRKVKFYFLDI